MQERAAPSAGMAFAIAGGSAVTVLFLSRFRPGLLLFAETALPLLACAAVVLASYAAGVMAIELAAGLLGPKPASHTSPLAAFLIGTAVLGSLVGITSWVTVAPIPYLTVALGGVGAVRLWIRRREIVRPRIVPPGALLLLPAVLLGFFEAITPVYAPDELVYKLAIPHAYQLYGRMVHLPLNSNSYLAMSFQMVDLAALQLAGGIAAKLFHFCLFVGALAVIHRLATRLGRRTATWVVVVIAYTPALLTVAGWAFNDWGVLALLLLSLLSYEHWLESRNPEAFVVAFGALGAAVAAKYTALVWAGPFILLVGWRCRREMRTIMRACLLIFLFGGFFYLRNAIWTGSPVAPFLLPHAPAVANYRSGYPFSGWVDLVRGLDVMDRGISDEALGVLLPVSFLAGLWALRSRDRLTRDLLLVGAAQMSILLTVAPGSRNMINGVAAVAIPGAVIIGEAWIASGSAARVAGAAVAATALVAQAIVGATVVSDLGRYLTGEESGPAYIARTKSFAPAFEWVAHGTRPEARLLMLGETRGFYLPRQYVSGGNLDGPRVAAWLAEFRTPSGLSEGLRAQGITHVLLNRRWYRVASPAAPPPSMLERELLLEVPPATHALLNEGMRAHGILRYRLGDYVIFELK